MKYPQLTSTTDVSLSRRRFVKGLALGGAAAGLALNSGSLLASLSKKQGTQVLSGTDFELNISEQAVNFTGTERMATTVNGSLPAPILRWKEGETVTLNVTNHLAESSSIHWHGLILPSGMDGVPGISNGFSGIPAGETFTYRFPVKQSGTYWYHSHSGFQEQTGLYGPIVIDPKEPEPFEYDRDYVVMLSDWSDEDPQAIYSKLKKLSHYYNFNERTHTDLMTDIKEKGLVATWRDRKMWNEMRMSQRDLSDVTGYTYTYLMNGAAPNSGWTGMFKKGEKVRLRFINGSAMTFFDLRIPGLKMTVVAADGQYVQPVTVDEFRIGVAETYDVIVEPEDDRAYTVFAQDIARSGYARGTLTPDVAKTAVIPAMDSVPNLSHGDMGMDMSAMGHDMAGMDHSQHDMGAMKGMDMSGMDHSQHDMSAMKGMDMSGMDHSAMGHDMPMQANPSDFSNKPIKHAETEFGPHVDARADGPQYRLDDPGVGLRNNGRRVLSYADLRNLYPTNREPEVTRELELHLTGNMGRYMWSINGIKFADAEPLQWKLGERIRITFVNDTMMNHPMHLHGMWSDLETGDNNYLPRKHTVIVQPGARISYRVTVDAEGGWAYHCHLLYHMLGMFRTVVVS
ncbi:MAG: copper resistance system multicopper oxidase [Gammaproteobacteria bacterium]|nr:copper resistance system multicopper oxidase [Gammaproteobacteria bacterium]